MPSSVTAADLLAQRAWVRDLARRLVRNDSDADDLAQEAMVTALERPPRERESLRPWFRRVLVNRARDRYRNASRRAHHERRISSAEGAPDPAELAAAADAHRLVIDAVMDLPENYRDVVLLRFFEGLQPADIATLRDMPASTVRTRLHRALATLRGELDQRHRGDRDAWVAALAPLVDLPASVTASGTVESAPRGPRRFWRMKVLAAAAAAILLVTAVSAYWPDSDEPSSRDTATGTELSAPDSPRARTRDRVRPDESSVARHDSTETTSTAPTSGTKPGGEAPDDASSASLAMRVAADERPVAGAEVRVFLLDAGDDVHTARDWTVVTSARTDERGEVTLAVPVHKPVHVRARLGDLVAVHPPFRLPDASARAVLDLALEDAVTLQGIVVDTSERPVPGALFVARMDVGEDDTLVRIAVSDGAGRFEMSEVPRSSIDDIVTYEVLAQGFVRGWGAVNEQTDLGAPLAIRLRPAVSVRGRCVDPDGAPIPGVYVSWDNQRGTDSDVEGRFRLDGLPRDELVLDFQPESHVPASHAVPPGPVAAHDLGDVVLATGVVTRGLVTDASGRAQPGAHVQIYAGDDVIRQGETDDSGHFEFAGVPDGPIRVEAIARSENGEWASPLEGTSGEVRSTAPTITVRLTAALSVVVDLRRETDGEILRVDGLGIEVQSLDDPDDRRSQGYKGGEMSSIRMRVARPGVYRVTIDASGFAPWTAERVEITALDETRLTARLRASE